MIPKEVMSDLVMKEMAEYSDGAYADHGSAKNMLERFARAIEAEALAADTALIRQLVDALEKDRHDTGDWPKDSQNALAACRARLEDKP